ACLSPEANPRPVATASLWQARQPVYRGSVGRWRHYRPWLGEFARLLPEERGRAARAPDTPAARLAAAIAAFRAERRDEAERLCREILGEEPGSLPALHMLGMLAARGGRNAIAIPLLREIVAREPRATDALNQLAALLHGNGQGAEAIALCERALAIEPDDPQTLRNLGLACLAEHRFAEAIAALRQAVLRAPRALPPRLDLARALSQCGEREAAELCLREALALMPDHPELYHRLGNLLQEHGRFAEAIAAFDEVIALAPRRTAVYLDRVYSKKTDADDAPLLARMCALLGETGLTDQDRANLHFALGKTADDLGSYAAAMRHFDEANRLKRRGRPFDRSAFAGTIGRLIRSFNADLFARNGALGSDSELPVLIVGMPRSGTTLVEQILSCHPQIGAGGELVFWGQRAGAVGLAASGRLAPETARRLAADYLALLRRAAPAARRVTDKMPQNFLHLGLVHLLFPHARIIHCRRNPIDTCLSLYSIQFTQPLDFAYDRGDLVFYYEHYARLMAHWRNVLPAERLLEIDYERLVADCERVSRDMIAFLGLAWDEACLSFERNERALRTASLWQARQPLFTGSLARWRRYEPWLGEFLRLLPHMVRDP
ncbi:MAG TPA: sulfotransferase, partial [Stellaceae bacterium]|nr:sulfotransferase [Stellaceae bacterium]